MMKIGIVGNGYVGQATALLQSENVKALIWDVDPKKRNINRLEDLKVCDLVFVCVPTPMDKDGSCYLDIVTQVVHELYTLAKINGRNIIVRSTVPVGTCEKLGVSFMPEFLTEANWKDDFKNNNEWIFGFDAPESLEERFAGNFASEKIFKLAELSDKKVKVVKTKEAELVKYIRNAFLATKISFFNEVEEFCTRLDVSYEEVRESVCNDARIGHSHSEVPGPDGKRGYGGTCLPKDMASLLSQMLEIKMMPYLIVAVRTRNNESDRPEKDWELNKGRSVI